MKKNLFVINLIWKHCQPSESFKALADGKDVFIGTKTGSGIFAYISSTTCAPCKTSSDWIRVLVTVTNEILKRESSKCILDPPRVERRGTRIVTQTGALTIWHTLKHTRFVSLILFTNTIQILYFQSKTHEGQTEQLHVQYITRSSVS